MTLRGRWPRAWAFGRCYLGFARCGDCRLPLFFSFLFKGGYYRPFFFFFNGTRPRSYPRVRAFGSALDLGSAWSPLAAWRNNNNKINLFFRGCAALNTTALSLLGHLSGILPRTLTVPYDFRVRPRKRTSIYINTQKNTTKK